MREPLVLGQTVNVVVGLCAAVERTLEVQFGAVIERHTLPGLPLRPIGIGLMHSLHVLLQIG